MNTEETKINMPPLEQKLASMLGLSPSEYAQLSHTGIRAISGLDGSPMAYYMMVSQLNAKPILEKLKPKMNKRQMIYFPPDAFTNKDTPADVTR